MELADAHVHFFRQGFPTKYGVFFPNGSEITFYEGIRSAHNIGSVLAVGYEGEPAFYGNNQYLAELAVTRPWLYPVAFLDALEPPSVEALRLFWQERFVGISLYVVDAERANRLLDWPEEVIAALNAHRAVVSINIPCPLLTTLEPFLKRLEQCQVLISHLGLSKPVDTDGLAELLRPLTRLAALPRLGVKASAFYAHGRDWHNYPHPEAQLAFQLLRDAFGVERLCWGSDFSPALEFVSIPQTIEVVRSWLDLNEAERAAVFGGNLRRMLGQRC